MPPHRHAFRPVAMGRRGVVASAHPLASMAGIEMMLAGGNAVDAAVAVAAALNVVEPYMSGLGGIGMMVVSHAWGRERHVLDFVGRVPKAARPERSTPRDLEGGPRACVTPGNPGGWLAAHERFGSMPRASVLAPAIRLAEDGVPLTWKNCEFIGTALETLRRSPEAQGIYLDRTTVRPGAILLQRELAGTYRELVEGGVEAFYRGPLARRIARAVREAGGWLSEEDLAEFVAEWRAPLIAPFRGFEIATMPPPFFAFQCLETLNILEDDPLEAWGHNSAEYLHHFLEAAKLAGADRIAWGFRDDVPFAALLSKPYAASQRKRIDPARAAASGGEKFEPEPVPGQLAAGHPGSFLDEHTTHFACADAAGTVVTVTQTLGAAFGSGFSVAGVLLNNNLKWMDLHPESPARLMPGRKGVPNMAPTQLFRAGEFFMSIGTPGSYGILQTTPQMILNVLAFGLGIQEAIEAPRVRAGRGRAVDVEARVAPGVRAELARRGHEVHLVDEWSWTVGGGQGIVRDPESGALAGGADPRRDGYAIAI